MSKKIIAIGVFVAGIAISSQLISQPSTTRGITLPFSFPFFGIASSSSSTSSVSCNANLICEPAAPENENAIDCPSDCYCGDGICNGFEPVGGFDTTHPSFEDAANCPSDCGSSSTTSSAATTLSSSDASTTTSTVTSSDLSSSITSTTTSSSASCPAWPTPTITPSSTITCAAIDFAQSTYLISCSGTCGGPCGIESSGVYWICNDGGSIATRAEQYYYCPGTATDPAVLSSMSCSIPWPCLDPLYSPYCSTDPNPCGNGLLDFPFEECDDGVANSDTTPDACRTNCTLATCGDGVLDTGEICDDGNTNPSDSCDNTCNPTLLNVCGNGLLEPPETCDTAATPGGPNNPATGPRACHTGSNNCRYCGDGNHDIFEESCDDGNWINGDGCDDHCRIEVECGNGVIETDGTDLQPGVAGIDDDTNGSVDDIYDRYWHGSDDEECETRCDGPLGALCDEDADCVGIGDGLCSARKGCNAPGTPNQCKQKYCCHVPSGACNPGIYTNTCPTPLADYVVYDTKSLCDAPCASGCLSDADCPGKRPHCKTVVGGPNQCVACGGATANNYCDCTGLVGTDRTDCEQRFLLPPDDRVCTDVPGVCNDSGPTPYCNSIVACASPSPHCVVGELDDLTTPAIDESTAGFCSECYEDSHCSFPRPRCKLPGDPGPEADYSCVECIVDSQCSSGGFSCPHKTASTTCHDCRDNICIGCDDPSDCGFGNFCRGALDECWPCNTVPSVDASLPVSATNPHNGCSNVLPFCVDGACVSCNNTNIGAGIDDGCSAIQPFCTSNGCAQCEDSNLGNPDYDLGCPGAWQCNDVTTPASCMPCINTSFSGAFSDAGCIDPNLTQCVFVGGSNTCQECDDVSATGTDAGCTAADPHCVSGSCTSCMNDNIGPSDTGCSGATSQCVSGLCEACENTAFNAPDDGCTAPGALHCDVSDGVGNHACVECLTDVHCPGAAICNTSNECELPCPADWPGYSMAGIPANTSQSCVDFVTYWASTVKASCDTACGAPCISVSHPSPIACNCISPPAFPVDALYWVCPGTPYETCGPFPSFSPPVSTICSATPIPGGSLTLPPPSSFVAPTAVPAPVAPKPKAVSPKPKAIEYAEPEFFESSSSQDAATSHAKLVAPAFGPGSECKPSGNTCVDSCFLTLCTEGSGIINGLLKSQCHKLCSSTSGAVSSADVFNTCDVIECTVERECISESGCTTSGEQFPGCTDEGQPILYYIDPCARVSKSDPYCGDGIKDEGEYCDGTDLGECASCSQDCFCNE